MIRSLLAGAALAAIALPTAASAAVTFDVSGTFVGGGSFSGFVTTSDNLMSLLDFSVTTTPGGGTWPYPFFPGDTYTKAGASSVTALPNNYIYATYPDSDQLRLYFAGALTQSGVALDQTAGEFVSKIGMRTVGSGALTRRVAAAVPEPATWALMILGFGMVGGAMRASIRRRKVTVSYA